MTALLIFSVVAGKYAGFNLFVTRQIDRAYYVDEERRRLHKKFIWLVPFVGPLVILGFWRKTGRIGNKMKRQFAIIFLAILVSCGPGQTEFDPATWNEMDDFFYANRETMVRDLMDNHLHIGMSYTELTELIGKPENYANMKPDVLAYEIMVDYGWDIGPVEGKTLVISLSKDSTVMGYKLEHWKH